MKRGLALLVACAAIGSMGAEVRTTNFIVIAANPQVCQQVAQWAEHYRREKAMIWLGREMPTWPEPCPLRVQVSMEGPSGATEFTFGPNRVNSMRMQIQGPLDRLIYSVLPHEITHTVFAHYFKCPVPRWMDEGGSVLSEDDIERERHDKLVRGILNRGQQIPMRTLFSLKEYPQQVMCLYAQGYSMSDYLVKRSNRQHLLSFVGAGMHQGWDQAVKTHFGHNTVDELEQAWLVHLRETKKQPQILAQNQNQNLNSNINFSGNMPGSAIGAGSAGTSSTGGMTVRMTVPPAQPLDPQAIARGAMPSKDQVGQRFGQTSWQPGVQLQPPIPIMPSQPVYTPTSGSGIQLGMPLASPMASPRFEAPRGVSPIGYPRP